MNVFKKQINAPDTSVSFTTVDAHVPPDGSFPVSLENGSKNAEQNRVGCPGASIPMAVPPVPLLTDPVCTCGADFCEPPRPDHPNLIEMDYSRGNGANNKRWNKTISFAPSAEVLEPRRHELVGCMSDEALFDRYYDYIGDCGTSCNKMDTMCGYTEFGECEGMLDNPRKLDERWRPRGYSQLHSVRGHGNFGRKLNESSGVSFSEPESLAKLGQFSTHNPLPYPVVCYPNYSGVPHSAELHPIPPIPRPPCLRGSLPRLRKGNLVNEVTTSV